MSWVGQVLALLKKDLRLELRRKELMFLALSLTAILAAVTGFALKTAFLTSSTQLALFPGLTWVIFLFSVTVTVARSYEHDLDYRAIDGLLVGGMSITAIYFSKLLLNFVTGLITYGATCLFLALFSGVSNLQLSLDFFLLVVLIVLACSALSVIIAPLTQNSALKALLFPLIYLPLLFVLFFIAVELSNNLLVTGGFAWNSPLIAILIAANVIYILAGVNLLDYTIKR